MEGSKFLIDVNLPKNFGFFNSDNFEFVIDINGKWPDRDIWDYAKQNHLVIVTKDTDFYHRCLLGNGEVKVIYLKIGNLLLRDLHFYFVRNWEEIISHVENSRLIIATNNAIQVIAI